MAGLPSQLMPGTMTLSRPARLPWSSKEPVASRVSAAVMVSSVDRYISTLTVSPDDLAAVE